MSLGIIVDDYNNDIKLQPNKALSQSVSCMDWSKTAPDHFACSLWDGTLKILQVTKNQISSNFKSNSNLLKEKASINITGPWPLTFCSWSQDGNAIFLGTSRGQIKAFDINRGQIIDLGMHQAPINYMKFIPQYGNTLLTSAYENNVHFWSLNDRKPIQTLAFSKKVFKASLGGSILATALADQKIGLVNLKAIHKKRQSQSTQLGKFSQIQTIQLSKDGKNLGLGTIDGRVNISYVQANSLMQYSWKTHITFKAQKTEQEDNLILYPVNSVNFHPTSEEWFSTCGGDGTMHFWNHRSKSKIKSFNYNSNPVCYSSVSHTGNYVAYALGNDWHNGPEGQKWKPRIAVHQIQQGQVKSFK